MSVSEKPSERFERLSASLPDRYELVRPHGQGGMATVFLAVDRKHDREVALKALAPELVAGIGAERFLREIEIAAHLNHPHILPLLDSGLAGELPYFVMPFVEGESLRERLAREGPLPLEATLRLGRDVAEALEYAHRQGVVHRDVKPGNILLTEGGAVVTDFGIAAALGPAEAHLTRTGQAVGTVGYMSPEQASGDPLDGRADQYSLACVIFEMLTGEPPFPGSSVRSVLGRQLSQPAPRASALRDAVPAELDEVLERALARTPADRFATAGELAAALDGLIDRGATSRATRLRPRPAIWIALAAAASLALLPWILPGFGRQPRTASTDVIADTSRYAIFPFENRAGVELPELGLLGAALSEWEGVDVVPGFQLREAMLRTGEDALTADKAAELALTQGAGRFLSGGIVRLDSTTVSVQAVLYEATPGGAVRLAGHQVELQPAADLDSLFGVLAAHLLWQGTPPRSPPGPEATRTMEAWKAFEAGWDALRAWRLNDADSAFSRALEWDADYPDAYLWRALVRAWSGAEHTTWHIPARQAALRSGRLAEREAAIAGALAAQAEGDLESACLSWEALAGRFPNDFAPWYGLAFCLSSDDAVVADPRTPTGWAFRSSRHRAIEAYQEAFRILPSILESFRGDAYASLRHLLHIDESLLRRGHGLGSENVAFLAYPAWHGDTLAFWPRPAARATAPASPEEQMRRDQAVQEQRRVFRQVAASWAADAPRSARAREALAIGLALLGERAALDTLERARSLATPPADEAEIAVTEIWLKLAFGLPREPDLLQEAQLLADSLLTRPAELDAATLSGLAALRGRALEAARHLPRTGSYPVLPGPATLAADEAALLVFAAMGGPADSLEHLTTHLVRRIDSSVPARERADLHAWLALPASLAYPAHPLPVPEATKADWLVAAQLAHGAGDSVAARKALEANGTARLGQAPYSRTLDAVYAEAALWAALGEPQRAREWMDPTLEALPQIPTPLSQPELVAALVRAAALRAEVASNLGDDADTRAWARAVTILWSDADPFLLPLVERMRQLAECEPC